MSLPRIVATGVLLSLVACGDDEGSPYTLGNVPPDPVGWCAETETWDPDWTAFEQEVVRLTNAERVAGARCNGLAWPAVSELTFNATLGCAARKHALDLAARDYLEHDSPDGVTASQRVDAAGYAWIAIGENISGGYPSPAAAVAGWMSSEGHCLNIMASRFVEIGVAYVVDDTPALYPTYWVQVFGTPR